MSASVFTPFLLFPKTFPSPSAPFLLIPSIQHFVLSSSHVASLKDEYRDLQRKFHPDLVRHRGAGQCASGPGGDNVFLRGEHYLNSEDDPAHILSVSNSAILNRRSRQDSIVETLKPKWSTSVDFDAIRPGLNEEVFEATMAIDDSDDASLMKSENDLRLTSLEAQLDEIWREGGWAEGKETAAGVREIASRVNEGRYWERLGLQINDAIEGGAT